MLDHKSRYQPNFRNVSAKVLDGEAVLIHITKGTYHSLDKVGSRIWQLIEERHSLDALASVIASEYKIDAESAQKDVAKLIEALLKEDLVLEATEAAAPLNLKENADRLPYEAPKLDTHRDMSDLLALDPPMPGLQVISHRSESEEK